MVLSASDHLQNMCMRGKPRTRRQLKGHQKDVYEDELPPCETKSQPNAKPIGNYEGKMNF